MRRVLKIKSTNFARLVKTLKRRFEEAEAFEIDLDRMIITGDLAVIQSYFKKPIIVKTSSLELMKKAVKANVSHVLVPIDFIEDRDLSSLLNNKREVTLLQEKNGKLIAVLGEETDFVYI